MDEREPVINILKREAVATIDRFLDYLPASISDEDKELVQNLKTDIQNDQIGAMEASEKLREIIEKYSK
jgi:hypothetical protein